MSWHYSIVNKKGFYAIHENMGEYGITKEPVFVDGDSKEEVIHVLEMMLADAKQYPVIGYYDNP